MRFIDMTAEQKEKVLEKNRYMCVDDSWWYQSNIEEAEEELESIGFKDAEISFSGFASQGGGASFTTKNVDIEKVLRHSKIWSKFRPIHGHIRDGGFTVEIYRFSNHYVHENTIGCNETYYGDFTDKQFDMVSNVAEHLKEVAQTYSRKIYRELEETYNDMTSDEYISEHIEINDYDFCEHHFTII